MRHMQQIKQEAAALPLSLRANGGEIQYRDQRDGTSIVIPLEQITLQPDSGVTTVAGADAFRATLRASYQDVPISFESLLRATDAGAWHANFVLDVGASDLEGTVEAVPSVMPLKLRADLQSSVIDAAQIIALMPAKTSEEAATVKIASLQQVDAALTLAIAELRLPDVVFTDNIATASSGGAVATRYKNAFERRGV